MYPFTYFYDNKEDSRYSITPWAQDQQNNVTDFFFYFFFYDSYLIQNADFYIFLYVCTHLILACEEKIVIFKKMQTIILVLRKVRTKQITPFLIYMLCNNNNNNIIHLYSAFS